MKIFSYYKFYVARRVVKAGKFGHGTWPALTWRYFYANQKCEFSSHQIAIFRFVHVDKYTIRVYVYCVSGGHGTFLGFINTFVHAIMYGYYLFSTIYPENSGKNWWKKYLTQLQMVRYMVFVIVAARISHRANIFADIRRFMIICWKFS